MEGCSRGGHLTALPPLPEVSLKPPEAEERLITDFSHCVSVLFSWCRNASDSIYPDTSGGNLPRSINYSWLLIDSFPELGQLT